MYGARALVHSNSLPVHSPGGGPVPTRVRLGGTAHRIPAAAVRCVLHVQRCALLHALHRRGICRAHFRSLHLRGAQRHRENVCGHFSFRTHCMRGHDRIFRSLLGGNGSEEHPPHAILHQVHEGDNFQLCPIRCGALGGGTGRVDEFTVQRPAPDAGGAHLSGHDHGAAVAGRCLGGADVGAGGGGGACSHGHGPPLHGPEHHNKAREPERLEYAQGPGLPSRHARARCRRGCSIGVRDAVAGGIHRALDRSPQLPGQEEGGGGRQGGVRGRDRAAGDGLLDPPAHGPCHPLLPPAAAAGPHLSGDGPLLVPRCHLHCGQPDA
mmetsp:Transcript_17551/g.56611  ORF Transcript_17551/g.56611 Transcript_17551/m.56611 type:complete len:323 (-) Transcript_17551:1363-2331(-)